MWEFPFLGPCWSYKCNWSFGCWSILLFYSPNNFLNYNLAVPIILLSANDREGEECISLRTKTYWIGCPPGGTKCSVHASSVPVEILHTNSCSVIQGMTCIFFKALIWIFFLSFCPSSFVFILSVKYQSGEDLNLFPYLENWPNNKTTFYSSDSAKCKIHRKSGNFKYL